MSTCRLIVPLILHFENYLAEFARYHFSMCLQMQDASNYEYTSMKSLNERKHGFWGDLARKAKSIIEDGASNKSDDYGRVQPPKLDSSTGTKVRHN